MDSKFITKFGWEVKIRSLQEKGKLSLCFGY